MKQTTLIFIFLGYLRTLCFAIQAPKDTLPDLDNIESLTKAIDTYYMAELTFIE
jgi:hypothetical protein